MMNKKIKDDERRVGDSEGRNFFEAKRSKSRKVKKLPIVDEEGYLKLITLRILKNRFNIILRMKTEGFGRCSSGRNEDMIERIEALIDAGVDVIVVDTAWPFKELSMP